MYNRVLEFVNPQSLYLGKPLPLFPLFCLALVLRIGTVAKTGDNLRLTRERYSRLLRRFASTAVQYPVLLVIALTPRINALCG